MFRQDTLRAAGCLTLPAQAPPSVRAKDLFYPERTVVSPSDTGQDGGVGDRWLDRAGAALRVQDDLPFGARLGVRPVGPGKGVARRRIVLSATVEVWSAGQARNSTMPTSVASMTVLPVTVAFSHATLSPSDQALVVVWTVAYWVDRFPVIVVLEQGKPSVVPSACSRWTGRTRSCLSMRPDRGRGPVLRCRSWPSTGPHQPPLLLPALHQAHSGRAPFSWPHSRPGTRTGNAVCRYSAAPHPAGSP